MKPSHRTATPPVVAALLSGLLLLSGGGPADPLADAERDRRSSIVVSPFRALEERYFVKFLERNPVTATYLGGDAYRPDLAPLGGRLRDHTSGALRAEDDFNLSVLGRLREFASGPLPPEDAVDAAVMEAQIRFLHDLTTRRRHHLRAIDTYMVEPFRGVDWQIQGMTEAGPGLLGTEAEWRLVVKRVGGIPFYIGVARANLREGVKTGVLPDPRMIEKDGLGTSAANAAYFETTLPALFEERTRGQGWAAGVGKPLHKAGEAAGKAYREFRRFVLETYYTPAAAKALDGVEALPGSGYFRTRDLLRPEFRDDRYAMGEAAYARALTENLRVGRSPAALFAEADAWVRETQDRLMSAAARVDAKQGWGLPWGSRETDFASTRKVIARLMEDHPEDDAQRIEMYRTKAFELVEYGRRHRLFEIPAAYRLEVTETPEVLRQSIHGAAYYPAPPFKETGTGRFYVTPTGNDPAHLRESCRASMADLCAHEGFPGHDWHYQFMRARREGIGKVRWLTPGAVEDSSSMWADSMMAEGWALYAEALMGEPPAGGAGEPGDGAYTPEERIFQLKGQLLRDVRVKVDVGIHTGRMSFDEAVAYVTENVDLLPGACGRDDAESRASCETATRAVFRYSKWPTQAITYSLGKREILALREEVRGILGSRFDLRAFHERILGAGTIPPAYIRDLVIEEARGAAPSQD